MGTLFHAFEDLLTLGTIVIAAMIAGGLLVILAMIADSIWLVREVHHAHEDEDKLYVLEAVRRGRHGEARLKKTA